MIYEDKFFSLKGEYEKSSHKEGQMLPFKLNAYLEDSLAYRMKGHFCKYNIEMTMDQVGVVVAIPMTLHLGFSSVPCTVYSEPYKTIYPGRAKISEVLLVLFYINKSLNVFCGKRNKQGVFVVQLMKDGNSDQVTVLKQLKNPRKVHNRHAVTLLDEKNQIGYVIEPHEH